MQLGYVRQYEALSLKIKFDAIYDVIMVSGDDELKRNAREYKEDLNRIMLPILHGRAKNKIK